MKNKYLERINRLYKDIIVPNRVKFEQGKWYKRNENNNDWVELIVYKSGQVSLSHSKGTATYTSHLSFLLNTTGPYTLEQLVDYMYNGVFHKFYGWVEGFWDKQTLSIYFEKLKENNEPLYEVSIKTNHVPFYKATRRLYKCEQSYRTFLSEMGENPDEVSGSFLVDKYLQEGRGIEHKITTCLKQLHAPYEYFVRFPSGATPDIYDRVNHSVIDIKRSIKTSIDKEINVYKEEFNNVTVIYLLGSRELIKNENGVKKLSFYKWLSFQGFFRDLTELKQERVLREIDKIVKSIDEGQFNSDLHDYHRTLVREIIEYDKKGLNNPQISERVGISYKYVNRILQGKVLQEYSGDYPKIYKEKQLSNKKKKTDIKDEAIQLFYQGLSNKEISDELNISKDMVNYYLRNAELNSKALINKRNEKIHNLLKTYTTHETLNEKFSWIADALKQEYPSITQSIIDNYYYSHFVRTEGEIKIIKGKENQQTLVIELFTSGKSREEISQILDIPITTVRDYLRKAKLGRKDILLIRNEKIERLLKLESHQKTLRIKFEDIARQLKEEFPDITARTVHTYYYTYFLKK
ncbi:LuxR C-terminal-related transcriptional regulator [Neobacillus sp. LXY-1]|uniref:LuxR C-terminal-related transcriptional regulator n=1 Tax=Neobacillus sp. LXY-1 TaxID=3379133 RepID=UPI003EE242B0